MGQVAAPTAHIALIVRMRNSGDIEAPMALQRGQANCAALGVGFGDNFGGLCRVRGDCRLGGRDNFGRGW